MKKNPRRTGNKQGKSKLNTEGNLRGFGRPGAGLKRGLAIFFAVTLALNPAFAHGSEAGGIDLTAEADMPSVSMGDAGGYVSDSGFVGAPYLMVPEGFEVTASIVVEAENYNFGSNGGDIWAAENDFENNGWDSADWSGGKGIRFGSWGYCNYTFTVPEDGRYLVSGYAASLAGNKGFLRFNIDSREGYLYVPEACGRPAEVPMLSSYAQDSEAGIIDLTAGDHTIYISMQGDAGDDAHWCYFDKFVLSRIEESGGEDPDPGPDPGPGEEPFLEVEAENCTFSDSLESEDGDGNFSQVSAGYALRNQGSPGTISGRVVLGEAGSYYVRVYVGSREGNSGTDSISIDGGTAYSLMVPEWTAPGWYGAQLRDPATGNLAGPLSLEAGEHTFEITSNAAWCYYDRIEFSKTSADAAVPELTISAVRGTAANNNFALGGAGLFADTISDRAVLRLTGDNTFTYTLHVPEAGNYKITSRASGKNGDSGTAVLRLNGTDYDVNVEASGLEAGMPLTEAVVAESVALEAGDVTVTLSTGTAAWCYIDQFVFTKIEDGGEEPDPGPDPDPGPVEDPFLEAEAEDCVYTGLDLGDGDGNFSQVSAGYALRNQGSPGTISGRVVLGEAGSYYVRVYVGSREGNSGTDSISIDGGTAYSLMVPEWTAPGWYGAQLRDPATGNLAGPLSLEAGEHTFEITSNAAWCYYDRIEFSKTSADAAVPELTISAVRGTAANNNFALGGAGLFADTISDRAVLRLTGDNTFTYTLHVPEAGNYKITSRASGKNGDSGTAVLRLNGTDYDVNVEASGLEAGMPLTEAVVAESVALEAGDVTVTLSTGTAAWCYIDQFVFTKIEDGGEEPDPGPDPDPGPVEDPFLEAEAEDCVYTGLDLGDGDGNFSQVSAGYALRNQGSPGTISGRVVLGEAGSYYVRVYVGSREGNSGTDSISIDGGTAYSLMVPEWTAPGWYGAQLRDPATGNLAGPLSLEAGEHTFEITSNAAWCYYDRIEFSKTSADAAVPELTISAVRGTAANNNFALGGAGLFADTISDRAVLRLTGDNTFTHTLHVPEAGDYKLTSWTIGKNSDGGTAGLEIGGEYYPVSIEAGGAPGGMHLKEGIVAENVALEAGDVTVTLTTGTAVWCYIDRFVLTKTDEPVEDPGAEGSLALEAARGRITAAEGSGPIAGFSTGDGNFSNPENKTYLRLWSGNSGDVTRVDWQLKLPETSDSYKVIVRMGTIGMDCGRNELIIGGKSYYFTTPTKESANEDQIQWYDLELTDRYGNPLGALPLTGMLTQTREDPAASLQSRQAAAFAEPAKRIAVQLIHRGGAGAEWCYLDSIRFEPSGEKAAPVNTLKTEAEAGLILEGKGSGAIYTTSDGNFKPSGGMSLRMMGGPARIQYTLEVPERGWYMPWATASSRADNSGRDKLRVENTECWLSIPAGIAPGRKEISWQTEDGAAATPVWLEKGECTLTLTYDNAAWCFYDTLELRPVEVPSLEELVKAIDALPESKTIQLAHSADFEKVFQKMKLYQSMAELYGWEKLDDARQAKMLLNKARMAALYADPGAPSGRYQYEWEDGTPQGGAATVSAGGAMSSADGDAYVYIFDGSVVLYFYVPENRRYHMFFKSAVDDPQAKDKCDIVILNGGKNYLYTSEGYAGQWQLGRMGKERYVNGKLAPQPPAGGYWLNAGWNAIVLQANWGYACYDSFYIEPADYYMYDGWYYPYEVEELIDKMPSWEQVKPEDYERVWSVFRAYLTLDMEGKYNVRNRDKLLMAQARADALWHWPDAPEGTLWYELEYSQMAGNSTAGSDRWTYEGYTGTGYAYLFDSGFLCEAYVPAGGTYDIYLRSGRVPEGDKCDFVYVNGTEYLTAVPAGEKAWQITSVGLEAYEDGKIKCQMPVGGIWMNGGWNAVDIRANWGYCAYDALIIMPGTGSAPGETEGAPYSRNANLQDAYMGLGFPQQGFVEEGAAWQAMSRGEASMDRTLSGKETDVERLSPTPGEETDKTGTAPWKYVAAAAFAALAAAAIGGLVILAVKKPGKPGKAKGKPKKSGRPEGEPKEGGRPEGKTGNEPGAGGEEG